MKATLTIHGKKYTASGDSPSEAISKLRVDGFVKSKSLLSVDYTNGEERTIVLYPVQTLRLFSKNKIVREVALKTTSSRF